MRLKDQMLAPAVTTMDETLPCRGDSHEVAAVARREQSFQLIH